MSGGAASGPGPVYVRLLGQYREVAGSATDLARECLRVVGADGRCVTDADRDAALATVRRLRALLADLDDLAADLGLIVPDGIGGAQ